MFLVLKNTKFLILGPLKIVFNFYSSKSFLSSLLVYTFKSTHVRPSYFRMKVFINMWNIITISPKKNYFFLTKHALNEFFLKKNI